MCRILKLAVEEAANSSPSEPMVGTEHILMGFLVEGDNVPARVLLHDFEIDAQIVRQELMHDGAMSAASAPRRGESFRSKPCGAGGRRVWS